MALRIHLSFPVSLLEHQEFFIQKGIYLVLEKLTYLTYRNLFKKVYVAKEGFVCLFVG